MCLIFLDNEMYNRPSTSTNEPSPYYHRVLKSGHRNQQRAASLSRHFPTNLGLGPITSSAVILQKQDKKDPKQFHSRPISQKNTRTQPLEVNVSSHNSTLNVELLALKLNQLANKNTSFRKVPTRTVKYPVKPYVSETTDKPTLSQSLNSYEYRSRKPSLRYNHVNTKPQTSFEHAEIIEPPKILQTLPKIQTPKELDSKIGPSRSEIIQESVKKILKRAVNYHNSKFDSLDEDEDQQEEEKTIKSSVDKRNAIPTALSLYSKGTNPDIPIEVVENSGNHQSKMVFTCPYDLLVTKIPYFKSEFQKVKYNSSDFEKLEISVQCDIKIFQQLLAFIKSDEKKLPDIRSNESLVSLLIASNHLRMESFLDLALVKLAEKLPMMIKEARTLVGNITDSILRRLINLQPLLYFDGLPVSKTRQRIFRLLTEKQATEKCEIIFKCKVCKKILSKDTSSHQVCKTYSIDCNGKILSRHEVDKDYDLNIYLQSLYHKYDENWRKLFWDFWLVSTDFTSAGCIRCDKKFQAVHLQSFSSFKIG